MTYERALETAINMRLRTDYAGNRVSAIKRMATVRRRKEARRLELKQLHMLKTAKASYAMFG